MAQAVLREHIRGAVKAVAKSIRPSTELRIVGTRVVAMLHGKPPGIHMCRQNLEWIYGWCHCKEALPMQYLCILDSSNSTSSHQVVVD